MVQARRETRGIKRGLSRVTPSCKVSKLWMELAPHNSDKRKLAAAIEAAIPRAGSEDESKWRQEMFGKVRILVVGRSGAFKSTLLRLMVGADGPNTISYGLAGEQDINREYDFKPDHNIPLIFHDSNGIDADPENLQIVRTFLQDRQSREDFSERVHLLWYVASACDDRIREDGGLLKELISGGFHNIPILVVLTHTDEVVESRKERALRALRELICNAVKGCSTAFSELPIITVGNDVEFSPENNRIMVHHRDAQGLKLVSSATYDLLGNEEMKATWAACQADDMHMKLELSAQKIADYALRSALSTPAAMVPYTDLLKITTLFNQIFCGLCAIWEVPKPLEVVLSKNILRKECTDSVLRSFASDTAATVAIAITAVATVFTAGATLVTILPPILSGFLGSGLWNGRTVTISVKGFALLVLANILYAKCRQQSKHMWDPNLTQNHCQALCDESLKNESLKHDLKQFVTGSHSTLDTLCLSRKEIVEGMLKSKMVDVFNDIWHDRPNSFASVSRFGTDN